MLRLARTLHRETGTEHLCLAGGVALNCVGNGKVLREGPFRSLWIQPAAGDAGGAVGVALSAWHRLDGQPRAATGARDGMRGGAPGSGVLERGDRALPRQAERPVRARAGRRPLRADRRRPGGGQGHRLVPGPDGVRAPGARRPQHSRRRAESADAVGHEPQDQVPGVVPALRAVRAAGARLRLLRDGRRQPLHAARRTGPGGTAHAR